MCQLSLLQLAATNIYCWMVLGKPRNDEALAIVMSSHQFKFSYCFNYVGETSQVCYSLRCLALVYNICRCQE